MTTELIRPDDALMQRMQMLRSILPTLATEVAIARREAARLRLENATLRARVDELEDRKPRGIQMPLTPPPAPLQSLSTGGMPR
jgi:regulator of replication initiation timing